jgi:MFS family permease
VGGFLTAEISWRFVFLVNLPLIAVIMIVALRGIQESHDQTVSRRLDVAGVILLATALTSLLIGLDLSEGSDRNPQLAVGLILLSLILFGLFTIVERATSNAIVDGKLLRLRPFLCSCVASCLLGFVFFLFLFIAALYLQEELGYSAFTAGIALVPFSLVLAVTGVMAGRLTSRFQLTNLLITSCVSMALGLATLSFLPASYGYLGMVFPFLLVAAGAGPGFTLSNTAGLAAVPPERSGQAAGIIYMFRFGGGAIGVAVASTLHGAFFNSQLAARLSETPVSAAQQKLLEQPGAIERLRQLESGLIASQIEQVRLAFHESFAAAFANTLRLNVILPIAIAVLVIALMDDKLKMQKR